MTPREVVHLIIDLLEVLDKHNVTPDQVFDIVEKIRDLFD